MTYYTVYLRENDEIVAFGTAEECAKMMNKTEGNFKSLVSKTCKGKNRKYEVFKERLSAEELIAEAM